jgi:hypothetical protein
MEKDGPLFHDHRQSVFYGSASRCQMIEGSRFATTTASRFVSRSMHHTYRILSLLGTEKHRDSMGIA